jgi:hypothetical protein
MKTLKKLTEHKGVRLTEVISRVKIDAAPEKVWDVLSQYGNVSSFHAGVVKSISIAGSTDKATMGAERVCDIEDGKRKIQFEERITEFEEGSHYRYEVFRWKNFPLKMMFFAFAVEKNQNRETILSLIINYRLTPGFLTGIMKRKIRKMEHEILSGYKNYIETGVKKVPIETIKDFEYQFA